MLKIVLAVEGYQLHYFTAVTLRIFLFLKETSYEVQSESLWLDIVAQLSGSGAGVMTRKRKLP